MQIKTFDACTDLKMLESQINIWLEANRHLQPIDVRIQTAGMGNEGLEAERDIYFYALVLYKAEALGRGK